MVSLWTVALHLYDYAGPAVTLVYPLYASITAIESPSKDDNTQWLTYWVLYSFMELVEIQFFRIIMWIPYWDTMKLVLVCWLVLPPFRGAVFLYDRVRTHIGAAKAHVNGLPFACHDEKSTPRHRRLFDWMSPRASRDSHSPHENFSATLHSPYEKLTPKQRGSIDRMGPRARASVSAFIDEFGSSAFDSMMASISDATKKSRSPISPARPKRSPTAAQPTSYSGSPHSNSKPSDDAGGHRSDSFREYCRQPVRLVKTGLHSMDERRKDIREKMRTNFVV